MSRRALVALALVAATALLAACGIPADGSPRDIAATERQEIVAKEAPNQAATAVGPKVYFLSSQNQTATDRLQPAVRDVAPTATALLDELLKGLNRDEQTRRWRTAIPSDTALFAPPTQEADGTLVVDLTKAFFSLTGEAQIKAVAQVVFTASGVAGVKRVSILIEGQPQDWPRGDGTLQPQNDPLTPFAYPELNPSTQPDYPPAPSPTTTNPPPIMTSPDTVSPPATAARVGDLPAT